MAYVAQQVPDFQQNQFGRKDDTTPNPVPPQTGGSSGGGQGGTGGTAPGFGSSTQFGSNAAKLSDYLNANKDQVGQFGQQVAGNLTQGYNDTMGAINQGTQQFGQQVGQGYTPYDASTVNKAATDPSGFAKDPNNVSKFQSMYKDQYSGPQNFEGSNTYAGINDQVNKAVENAGLTGNAAGLGTYLNTKMGANDNTEGMRSLDTALLLGNKDSSKAISDAAAPYKNLQTYLSGQTQTANAGVQTAKQAADQARQSAQSAIAPRIAGFQSDIGNRVNQGEAQRTTYNKTVNDLLSKEQNLKPYLDTIQADADRYNQVGQPVTRTNPFTLDTSSLQPTLPSTIQNAANPNTIASADDFALQSALNQLTGADLNVLDPSQSASAGTFQVPGAPPPLPTSSFLPTLQNATSGLESQYAGKPVIPMDYINLDKALKSLSTYLSAANG